MSFVQDCPICHKAVTIADDLVGIVVSCPHCDKYFSISEKGQAGVEIEVAASVPAAAPSSIRFNFVCQRCDSVLEARGDLCSQPGTCPTCGALFVVPKVDPTTGLAAGPAIVADDGQLPTPLHAYATAGDKAPVIRRLDENNQVVICPRCRTEMPIDADLCSACGVPFTLEGAASIGKALPEANNIATLALTVGIAGVLTSPCQPFIGVVAVILGIAAFRKAERIRTKQSGRTFSLIAILCGILAIGAFAVIFAGKYL